MANKKLDQLTNLSTIADEDLLLVYDVDGAGSEKTKNMTYTQFHDQISGTVGGGGGGSDTPWTEDHDPAGYSLKTSDVSSGNTDVISITGGDNSLTAYSNAGIINIYGGEHTGGTSGYTPGGGYAKGGRVVIQGGRSDGDYGEGGNVVITSGYGGHQCGQVFISGASAGGTTTRGGQVNIFGGANESSGQQGGNVSITGGFGDSSGGKVTIEGGRGKGGAGGHVEIDGGVDLTGTPGDVILRGGDGGIFDNGFVSIDGQKFPKTAGTPGQVLKTDGTDCYWG